MHRRENEYTGGQSLRGDNRNGYWSGMREATVILVRTLPGRLPVSAHLLLPRALRRRPTSTATFAATLRWCMFLTTLLLGPALIALRLTAPDHCTTLATDHIRALATSTLPCTETGGTLTSASFRDLSFQDGKALDISRLCLGPIFA